MKTFAVLNVGIHCFWSQQYDYDLVYGSMRKKDPIAHNRLRFFKVCTSYTFNTLLTLQAVDVLRRGVFCGLSDPLVFEKIFNFSTKIAKMRVKE